MTCLPFLQVGLVTHRFAGRANAQPGPRGSLGQLHGQAIPFFGPALLSRLIASARFGDTVGRMIDLGSIAGLLEHDYQLAAYCPHCGEEIWDQAEYCPNCDQHVGGETLSRPPQMHWFRQRWMLFVVIIVLLTFVLVYAL